MKTGSFIKHVRTFIVLSALLFWGMNTLTMSQGNDTPWRTPEGRACIDAWMRDAISRLNASDLGSDYNDRKPWRFGQYGALLGRLSFDNYAPDLFPNYDNVQHWVWAHYNRDSYSGLWTGSFSFINRADVPSCKDYTRKCIERAGGGGVPPGPGSKGATPTSADYVEQSERLAGDGTADWAFPIRVIGKGTVISVSINNTNGIRSIWDTIPNNGNWLSGVFGFGRILNNSDGSVRFNVDGTTDLSLYVADNRSLSGGNTNYVVTVTFLDGRTVTIDPAVSRTGRIPDLGGGGSISGYKPPSQTTNVDIVGPSETLRGEGNYDWVFPISLSGIQGTITGITVQSTDGTYSVWDTFPANGKWLVGVATAEGRGLNNSDGSVAINVTGPTDLYLYVHDNGSLGGGRTNFKVIISLQNGRTVEREISR